MVLVRLEHLLVADDTSFYSDDVDSNVKLIQKICVMVVEKYTYDDGDDGDDSNDNVRLRVTEIDLETYVEMKNPAPVMLMDYPRMKWQFFSIRYLHCKLVVDKFSVLHRALQQQPH